MRSTIAMCCALAITAGCGGASAGFIPAPGDASLENANADGAAGIEADAAEATSEAGIDAPEGPDAPYDAGPWYCVKEDADTCVCSDHPLTGVSMDPSECRARSGWCCFSQGDHTCTCRTTGGAPSECIFLELHEDTCSVPPATFGCAFPQKVDHFQPCPTDPDCFCDCTCSDEHYYSCEFTYCT